MVTFVLFPFPTISISSDSPLLRSSTDGKVAEATLPFLFPPSVSTGGAPNLSLKSLSGAPSKWQNLRRVSRTNSFPLGMMRKCRNSLSKSGMASRGKSGAKSSSSYRSGFSARRNCAGPNNVSLNTLLIFISASTLSTISVQRFLCTKKLKYAGNSNSAKFTPNAGPISRQNRSTGTMYTEGTAIPSRIESLMVSGGIPNWTCPTA
mmetsp:Transcript_27452/g.46723  ORF Transcript_27452/g.46723 Transcript_27452/m.46723 type:complete len:206 (+) Transcript_27452:389-1006(+)